MTHASFGTSFEIKFLAETGAFEGYASVFHVTDSVNDRVAPGAFRGSLAKFGEEGRLPPLLWQHDTSEPIGAWREMYEDEHGLYVKGELFVHDIPLAREAMKLLKENVVTGLSIGYRAQASHRDRKTGVRVLTEVDLHEVSLVTFPANDYARVSKIKRPFNPETPPSVRDFETFLRTSGLSRAQAKGIIAKGYKGLTVTEEDEAADLIAQLRNGTRQLKFSQNQPRVPAGNSGGGQWTGGGGIGSTIMKRVRKVGNNLVEVARNHPFATGIALAMVPVAGPEADISILAAEGGGAAGTAAEGAAVAAEGLETTAAGNLPVVKPDTIEGGSKFGEKFISKQSEKLTGHGQERIEERLTSQTDAEDIIRSAIKNRTIKERLGTYKTKQYHYLGENGKTVILETSGRNAGKIVTILTGKK